MVLKALRVYLQVLFSKWICEWSGSSGRITWCVGILRFLWLLTVVSSAVERTRQSSSVLCLLLDVVYAGVEGLKEKSDFDDWYS